MADPGSERSEELARLGAKAEAMAGLIEGAKGKLLEAENAQQAEEAIFCCFLDVAFGQAGGMYHHLLGDESVGDLNKWAIEASQELKAIREEGDWTAAKEHVLQELMIEYAAADWAKELDLDPAIYKDYSGQLGSDFIKKQVNLVSDRTEPYTHPNLEVLKTQIASI